MNKTRQFWTLAKFLIATNPFVLIIPLMIGIPYFIPYLSSSEGHDYLPRLEYLLSDQNIWLVGFFTVQFMAPEVMQSGVPNTMWTSGTEFLLTRAVDRYLVCRARSAVFYFLLLTIPSIALLGVLGNPDLKIDEHNKISRQQVLDHMPGHISMSADGYSETITIPNGNILVKSWNLWMLVCMAVGLQVFVSLIFPLKYRRFLVWGVFLIFLFSPLGFLGHHASRIDSLSTAETVFFVFIAHQSLFWITTIFAVLFGQLWCERRFSRLEQL